MAERTAEAGISLVEVLAAMAILTLVLLPMLDFAAYTYNGQAYERQLVATLAASKMEELQAESYRSIPESWPVVGQDNKTVGNLIIRRAYDVVPLPDEEAWWPEREYVRKAIVSAWCSNCRNQQPITVVGYIAKLSEAGQTEKLPDPAE